MKERAIQLFKERALQIFLICACFFFLFSDGISQFNRKSRPLRRAAEQRINIANIWHNFELLFEHGYLTALGTDYLPYPDDDMISIYMRSSTEDGLHDSRIRINRTYQITPGLDIPFSIRTQTHRFTYWVTYRADGVRVTSSTGIGFRNRRVAFTHSLIIKSEAVEIFFFESTSTRHSRTLFDELNLILDVVNLESTS